MLHRTKFHQESKYSGCVHKEEQLPKKDHPEHPLPNSLLIIQICVICILAMFSTNCNVLAVGRFDNVCYNGYNNIYICLYFIQTRIGFDTNFSMINRSISSITTKVARNENKHIFETIFVHVLVTFWSVWIVCYFRHSKAHTVQISCDANCSINIKDVPLEPSYVSDTSLPIRKDFC